MAFSFLSAYASRAAVEIDLDLIALPPGFAIEVWTDEVPNARSLALGAQGTVFVSTRRDGRVYAIEPRGDEDPVVHTLASRLKTPNGVAFYDGDLYVAENHRIIRYSDIESDLDAVGKPEIVVDDLPTRSHHGWRYIDFGPDGKLYIAIGAPCNVCVNEGFANISRMNPDGSEREIVVQGVRNSVGFTWHPETGELWFTDNGRDMLGDNLPPGELNRVTHPNQHFGFPFCHGTDIPDPEFGKSVDCGQYSPPAQELGPHVAPLGVTFYDGNMFPTEYIGNAFVAEHGSWNRSSKIGYRVTMIEMAGGNAISYKVFAEGWLQGQDAQGRPVDLLVLDDGSVLLSDDQNGAIYRISYTPPNNAGAGL